MSACGLTRLTLCAYGSVCVSARTCFIPHAAYIIAAFRKQETVISADDVFLCEAKDLRCPLIKAFV